MSSISDFWNKHKKAIIIFSLIIVAVVIAAIVIIVCYLKIWKKKDGFKERYVTMDDTKDEKVEPFMYVKKWIDACIGLDNKTIFSPKS